MPNTFRIKRIFGLTSEQEQTLRDAGANDGVIRVIHNNRR
jgi:hypothetical protein